MQVKGVDNKYPLYGRIKLSPEIPLDKALMKSKDVYGVIVAKSLLERLNVNIGDKVKIGNKLFKIRAKIIKEPFRKNNNWLRYEFLIIKNCVSSLPKWYEATIKKIIKEIYGMINHNIITVKAIKIYDK